MTALREEAVQWYTRMRSVAPDDPLHDRFKAWLDANPAHAAEYAAFAGFLSALESPANCDALADAMEQRRTSRQLTRRRMLKNGVLALLVVGLAGEGFIYASRHRTIWQLAQRTGIGELRSQSLPDGSMVTLGAASGITAAFSVAERNVRLDNGEAIFEVTKDVERPFVVESGPIHVTVRGTRFAVAQLGDRIRVSVEHGQVLVETGSFWRRQSLPLRNGQVAEISLIDGEAVALQYVARSAAAGFAFEQGSIPFEQAGLDEVASTLSRYRAEPVRAVPAGHGGTPRITALVQGNNVEGFLHLLPRIAPVTVTAENGGVVLGPR